MRATATTGVNHVARWDDAVAVIGPPGPHADELVTVLDAMATRDGEYVRSVLSEHAGSVSAAVVLLEDGNPATSVVTGDGFVSHGGVTVTADAGVASGSVTGGPVLLAVDPAATASAGGVGDLRAGVVLGGALTLHVDPVGAPPGEPSDTPDGQATIVAQTPSARFDFVDLRTSDGFTREPLPIATPPDPESDLETIIFEVPPAETAPDGGATEVFGILCARHHFNHPHARYCNRCGLSMLQLTHNRVAGPRPTLGFVVFDDGATWALDRSYIVGRESGPVTPGGLDRLVIGGDGSTVSADHAEIRLEEWDVTLVDLGSTNGTFVWDAAANAWERLTPRRPVTLPPGTAASIGHRSFVYESALLRR